ncbi:hypothetical protein Tco_0357039 [Tanacetum coccineum]
MTIVRFHYGLNNCQDGGGNGLTKTSLITYLHDRHCSGDAQAIMKQYLSTNLAVFEDAECRHDNGSNFVSVPDCGDGVVRFLLYDITKPHVPSSSEQLEHVNDLGQHQHGGFTLSLLNSLLLKGLHTVKFIPPKCHLRFSRVLKGALDKVICMPDNIFCWVSFLVLPLCGSLQLVGKTLAESSPSLSPVDEEDLDLGERNIKQCMRKICDSHYTAAVRVLSSSCVAPYNHATLEDLKTKHPFKPAPSLLHLPIDSHHLIASPAILVSSITQAMNLFLDGKCPKLLGEYIDSAPITPLVKPGGGIRPIDVGTIWRRLVSKYVDDGTIVGDTLVVRKVLELIMEDGPCCGLHLNIDKTEVFWLKEDPRSRLAGISPPNISRPSHDVKLLGGPISVDIESSSELVMKRVAQTIKLMDAISKINDPQCELLLLRACNGISKLYFAM